MLKKYLLLILFIFNLHNTYAQRLEDLKLPTIIPPPAEAAALGRYGQISADKSTGIPQISIPIYEIKTPKLSLPISLSYMATGVKVDETASWVGLGWSLNAGGVITRSILDRPDETGFLTQLVSMKKANEIQLPTDQFYLEQIAVTKNYDFQPDNFFYNFNGNSGSFVFGEDKKPVLTPYKPLKIINTNSLPEFTILDEQGNIYRFANLEYVQYNSGITTGGVSSWYLTSITSGVNSADVITFEYQTDSQVEFTFGYTQIIGPDFFISNNEVLSTVDNIGSLELSYKPRVYPAKLLLKTITFTGGKVEFTTKAGRSDNGSKSLDYITIYNYDFGSQQYTKQRSISFQTGYFYNNLLHPVLTANDQNNIREKYKYRLKLTGITEKDKSDAPIKTHQFEYNESISLPPQYNFGQDKWGYYNGHTENLTLIETQTVSGPNNGQFTIGQGQGGNRTVDTTAMKAGILQKIIYPTKGYSIFTYEPNSYSSDGVTIKYGGGLRIQTIKNFNNDNTLQNQEYYTYNNSFNELESGYGLLLSEPYALRSSYDRTYFYSTWIPGYGFGISQPRTKRHFTSTSLFSLASLNGSPVAYKSINVYQGTKNQNVGKTRYEYEIEQDSVLSIGEPEAYYQGQKLIPVSWKSGFERYQGQYRREINGVYTLVQEKKTDYITIYRTGGRGQIAERRFEFLGDYSLADNQLPKPRYYWYDYPISSGSKKPSQVITITYPSDNTTGAVQDTVLYNYENLDHVFPTKITQKTSKGESLQRQINYPQDMVKYNKDPSSLYSAMVTGNRINSEIEVVTKRNNVQVSTLRNNHNWMNPASVLLESVEYNVGTNPTADTRLRYNHYDIYGNVLEVSKADGPSTSYIWGYGSSFPVAEVINASYNQIFYEGFEQNGTAGSAHTGNRYYAGDYTLSFTIPDARSYRYSYWYLDNGIWKFSGIRNYTAAITITDGSAIDDVRVYPLNAQMQTYTYEPLNGVASKTDAREVVTKYEFDSFQRLKAMKDQNGNIIKSYNYHYKD